MVVGHVCHSTRIVKTAPSLSLSLPFLQKLHIVISEVPYLPTYQPVPTYVYVYLPTYLTYLTYCMYVHMYICTLGKTDIICKTPKIGVFFFIFIFFVC